MHKQSERIMEITQSECQKEKCILKILNNIKDTNIHVIVD